MARLIALPPLPRANLPVPYLPPGELVEMPAAGLSAIHDKPGLPTLRRDMEQRRVSRWVCDRYRPADAPGRGVLCDFST